MARANQTYIQKLTVKFLRAAKQQGSGNMRGLGGVLLGGDPGIGKTTFVELFSDLTGIHLITIEIPHIVEEHIINIHFLCHCGVQWNALIKIYTRHIVKHFREFRI